MRIIKTLVITLIAILLIDHVASAQAVSCKPIDFSVKKTVQIGNGASLVIDLKKHDPATLSVNLIKPKGEFLLDVEKLEFNHLEKGEYVVVVTGKSTSDNYCPAYKKLKIE